MRTSVADARRILFVVTFALVLLGLTAHSAGASEGCVVAEDRLRLMLLDPSPGDSVVTVVELEGLVGGISPPAEQARIQAILNQAAVQGNTSFRYDTEGPCPTPTPVTPTATPVTPTVAPTGMPVTPTTIPVTVTVTAPATVTTTPSTSTTTPAPITPGPTQTATVNVSPTSTAPPGTTFGTVSNTGGDNLRCRTAPVSGAVIVSLGPGTQVEVRGPLSNGWYPVRCAGQNGFVSAQYLTVSGGPTPTATPGTPTPTPAPGGTTGTVTNTGGDNLRCRTAPVNGSVITSLAPGTQVELRGPVASGWYPVRCAGQNGFVSAQYLTVSRSPTATPVTSTPTMTPTSTPATSTPTPTVTPVPGTGFGTVSNTGGDTLRCRVSPINGSVITSLAPSTQVELRGPVSNGWYPVRCAEQNGFVSAQYLTVSGGNPTPPPGTTVGYIDTAGAANANCRNQPSLSGGIITTVSFGSQVTIRGAAVYGWTPVRCGNQDGWISSPLIASTPPSGLGPVDRIAVVTSTLPVGSRTGSTASPVRWEISALAIRPRRSAGSRRRSCCGV